MSQTSEQDPLAWNFYRNPRQPYDEFVANYILKPQKFRFVQTHYNRSLAAFRDELPQVMHRYSTLPIPGGSDWLPDTIETIEKAGLHELFPFLDMVAIRPWAQAFLERSGLPQPHLMGWMDYLKQWWFPYPATLRQLVEEGDALLNDALAKLKAGKIANSLALLEAAAGAEDRAALARQAGVAGEVLLDLVQRADVSRLPYTSGGAVKRLWAMGYCSLAALRAADPQEYGARADAYFAAGGKGTSFDAKMGNILTFLADARHAPEVVITPPAPEQFLKALEEQV